MSTDLSTRLKNPSYQAFALLRTGFTVAPILFGLDKFTNILTEWTQYLAPWIDNLVPGDATMAMRIVGVIEILAGLLVGFAPRIGAYVVALWLAGIIVNLLTLSGFYDIALRDFGLMIGALALGRLAQAYAPDRAAGPEDLARPRGSREGSPCRWRQDGPRSSRPGASPLRQSAWPGAPGHPLRPLPAAAHDRLAVARRRARGQAPVVWI
jgi:uncharacterized membrane protein YphA (DoxX/SURF4 family)